LTAFAWPDGTDEAGLRGQLLDRFGIEVGGGLGDFAGTAWRVGLMGHGATHQNVDRLLAAIDELLEA
jgi:alanine-glyoxylate transaminase/serine-glyoxylate transaminase/serine-pyruvate transaminase